MLQIKLPHSKQIRCWRNEPFLFKNAPPIRALGLHRPYWLPPARLCPLVLSPSPMVAGHIARACRPINHCSGRKRGGHGADYVRVNLVCSVAPIQRVCLCVDFASFWSELCGVSLRAPLCLVSGREQTDLLENLVKRTATSIGHQTRSH